MEEEEPGEPERVDQPQLVFEPRARLLADTARRPVVPVGEGRLADLRELADRRVGPVREVRVAVAELAREVELEALRDLHRPGRRLLVDAREALGHLLRGSEERLAVATPLDLAAVERGAAADRDEGVLQQRPPGDVGVDVAGGDRVDAEVPREVAEQAEPPGVAALERALELDVEPLAAERLDERNARVRVAQAEPVTRAAREARETVVQLDHRREGHGRWQQDTVLLAGRPGARVRRGEEAAQVGVAARRLDEERQVRRPARRLDGDLGSRDRPQAERLRRVGELERAVDPVVVGERERRVAELGRPHHELLRHRGPVEERERRVAVELDVSAHLPGVAGASSRLHTRRSPFRAAVADRSAKYLRRETP